MNIFILIESKGEEKLYLTRIQPEPLYVAQIEKRR